MRRPGARRALRAAQERATDAEVERLCALPTAELAVALMAAFGDEGSRWMPFSARPLNLIVLSEWLLRRHRVAGRHLLALQPPVRAALHALEDGGLIVWEGSESIGAKARLRATATGRVALAQGNVRDYVEPDDEPHDGGER